MLKKIAHNSTIPSLAGNKDIRPLQDLITAEKAVLVSLQKLSVDFTKASEALRAWAVTEGDDLADTLIGSTKILSHYSTALTQYAAHEHDIRDSMKSVRTREEGLYDLKRRRQSLYAKADAADKKLSKMNPEHKNLAAQTDILGRLKEDIQAIDAEILAEEASLGDFKRTAARAWMSLKFGGLLECCEHGSIVGRFGKLIVAEIPEDVTRPGKLRGLYNGHAIVDGHVNDAYRSIADVAFSGVPSSAPQPRQSPPPAARLSQDFSATLNPNSRQALGDPARSAWSRENRAPADHLTITQGFDQGRFMDPADTGTYPFKTGQQQAISRSVDDLDVPVVGGGRFPVDDFGVPVMGGGGPSGGRFATFPVKNNRGNESGMGYALRDNPVPSSLDGDSTLRQSSDSFASSTTVVVGGSHQTKESTDLSRFTPPPGPAPPGARLAENPWANAASDEDDSGSHLAYMAGPPESMYRSDRGGNRGPDAEKHVRFGGFDDPETPRVTNNEEFSRSRDEVDTNVRPAPRISPSRVPPPKISAEEEERSLNAAAAREVSRELDALNFNPPSSPMDSASPSDHEAPLPVPYAPQPYYATAALRDAPPHASRTSEDLQPSHRSYSPSPPRPQISSRYPTGQSSPTNPRSPVSPNRDMSFPAPTPPSVVGSIRRSPPMKSDDTPAPYRTQPEYQRIGVSAPIAPLMTKTASSASSSPASTPPGARTITAAAFKRPQPRLALPSSPYPSRASPGNPNPSQPSFTDTGRGGGSDPTSRPRADSKDGLHRQQQDVSTTSLGAGDEFDYIAAYVNNMGTGSEHGGSGQVGGQAPTKAGYAEGKFATDLEELR